MELISLVLRTRLFSDPASWFQFPAWFPGFGRLWARCSRTVKTHFSMTHKKQFTPSKGLVITLFLNCILLPFLVAGFSTQKQNQKGWPPFCFGSKEPSGTKTTRQTRPVTKGLHAGFGTSWGTSGRCAVTLRRFSVSAGFGFFQEPKEQSPSTCWSY